MTKVLFLQGLYLEMENELGKKIIELDARPSDSIVLALQMKNPSMLPQRYWKTLKICQRFWNVFFVSKTKFYQTAKKYDSSQLIIYENLGIRLADCTSSDARCNRSSIYVLLMDLGLLIFFLLNFLEHIKILSLILRF